MIQKAPGLPVRFDEPRLEVSDYEQAAQMHYHCRGRGIAGSTIDLLICSVADRRNWQIFTTDRDFGRYESVLGVKLPVVGGVREIAELMTGGWNRTCRRTPSYS